jgi:hypothetical protein
MERTTRHPTRTDKSQAAAELPRLLTEKEIARYLRVSRDAITRFKRHCHDPIPYEKAGRRCLYDIAAVRAWTRRNATRDQHGGGRFLKAPAAIGHEQPEGQDLRARSPR